MTKESKFSVKEDKEKIIYQVHDGCGDNVHGDKKIQQAITPVEIRRPIENILKHLRHSEKNDAKKEWNVLKSTSNLSSDALGILEVLNLLLDISDGSFPKNAYESVKNYLDSKPNEFCLDICYAVQIQLDYRKERLSDARERYYCIDAPQVYTKEAFYALIATQDEIESVSRNNRFQLSEIELSALVRGALRISANLLALETSEYLRETYPSFNSKTLMLMAKANIINGEIAGKHYWHITATSREKFISLCDEIANLLNKCEGKDVRVVHMASSALKYISGEHKLLSDACWNNIVRIEEQYPDVAAEIRYIYEGRTDNLSEFSLKISKSRENISFREDTVREIIQSKEITPEDSTLLSYIADKKSLQTWLSKGGNISSEDTFERAFSIFELKARACDNSPQAVEELRIIAEKFIQQYKNKLQTLNPPRLLLLTQDLLKVELSFVASKLLGAQILENDIWPSPIVHHYLDALLDSQQLKTLDDTLRAINSGNWDASIYRAKARYFEIQEKLEDAISCMDKAVELKPLLLDSWEFLLHLHKKNNDAVTLRKTLDQIPNDALDKPSEIGFSILAKMLRDGDFKKAEKYLIDWFISDPDRYASLFSDVYLSILINIEDDNPLDISEETKNCLRGVRYSSNGRETIKLLVIDIDKTHPSLLSAKSPLGKLLLKMSVGETKQHGMQDIILLESFPPYIAAFRIASDLREALNDGTDIFLLLSIADNPEETIKNLTNKLSRLDSGMDIWNTDPKIPLFVKGYHLDSLSPVKDALIHLTNKESVKHPLPSFGENSPSHLIVDVYSVVYLALVGFVNCLAESSRKIIITTQTKYHLEEWLEEVNRSDYLTIGVTPDGYLTKTTAEDIKKDTIAIQEAIKKILENSDVIAPNVADIPSGVSRVRDIVDSSVFSSLRLSITNDIPWLCIDPTFAQLAEVSGYKTVNANLFFSLLGHDLKISEKQQGIYLHVSASLPYALTYTDFMKLSKSKDQHAYYFLAELLKRYPDAFLKTNMSILFLYDMLINVLISADSYDEIWRGSRESNPRNQGYIERVFYSCCYISIQYNIEKTAEYNLALLIAYLLEIFQKIEHIKGLVKFLGSRFIQGHFLSLQAVNDALSKIHIELKNMNKSKDKNKKL